MRVKNCLRPGGIFAANMLSVFDRWNQAGNTDLAFYERHEVEGLLANSGFKILLLQEIANDQPSVSGRAKRFWDAYEFIAQNPVRL